MKIFYIVNARIPTEKAHGYQICKMCEEFVLDNCELELIVPEINDTKDDLFYFYKLSNVFAVRYLKILKFLKFHKCLGRFAFYLQSWSFYFRLFFLNINDKKAVIYTRNPEIVWIFKLRGFKVAYECHDWFASKTKIALFFLKNCDYLITTNNFIEEQFRLNGFKKDILVAPNGVDLDMFDLNISKQEALDFLKVNDDVKIRLKNKKVLLYTGSYKTMGVDKGINDILKALKKIENDDLIFLAVGGSEKDIEYYENIAKDEGVFEKTIFLSRFEQKDLALFQKAADVLLMPFPDKAHYKYFMTPLKMFEYMCSGRLIIASSLPSIKEVLNEKNCIFCNPDDVDDLGEKIEFVLDENNKEQVDFLRKQALSDVENYTWSNRSKKIIDFIR